MSGSRFYFDAASVADRLTVASFTGRERSSRPYRFALELIVPSAVEPARLLGARARLSIEVGGKLRLVAGVVDRVRRGDVLAHGASRVRVRLVPTLQRLAHRRASRIFQDQSTRSVVAEVLREHGVAFRTQLALPEVVREICVQHEETDLELVHRLLAEEGIAYSFEQPEPEAGIEAAETLFLHDEASAQPPLPGGSMLAYRADLGGGSLVREEHHVGSFVHEARTAPVSVLLSAFDLQHPEHRLEAAHPPLDPSGATTLSSVHEHHGPFGETQVELQPAARVLEQVRRTAARQRGTSQCARLSPGYRVELEGHDDPTLQGGYAVVDVEHRGHGGEVGPAAPSYENVFGTVRDGMLLRPPRPRRSVRQSLDTAIVTGPPGEEIHTDELGRIKIRFHWDRRGDRRGESSCWVRVAQAWAGAGYGAQFIPRVGMEVIVAFLGGDPDRPMVVGCVPNATHPPAFSLPGNQTKSGFRTRSSPDHPAAGHNELSFEDASGQELVQLVAKRRLEVLAHDELRTTSRGTHQVEVGGDHRLAVVGDYTLKVEGAASTEYIGGASIRVEGGLSSRASGDVESTVEGSSRTIVDGSTRSESLGGREDAVVGPWVNRAAASWLLEVGTAEARGQLDVQVRGDSVHAVDGRAVIEAREGLVLVCGSSRVELSTEGVIVRGPSIRLEAPSIVARADGPSLELTDRAEMRAEVLELYGKESKLELDRDATIKGAKVYLNCGPPPPPATDEAGEPATQKLRVKLSDERFEPYADKAFELRAESFKHEGRTGAGGEVEVDVPRSARVAHITVWPKAYPTGPTRSYAIEIARLPPATTVPGVRARLKNLGYFDGPSEGDQVDSALHAAITTFQTDHQLEPSGRLDEATRSRVLERHGS